MMVRPPKKFTCSDKRPQFFKIYIPDQSSQRLGIPSAFNKHFGGCLPYKSVIKRPAKRSWWVEVNKVGENIYFQKGWQEFVEDNSLEFGDFLVFSYAGKSIFYVQLFGKNGCTKEVAIPTGKNKKSQALAQDIQTFEPSDSSKEVTKTILLPRGPSAIQEKQRAIKAAGNIISDYPSFEVVMKPAYVVSGLMNIPSSFRRSHMEKRRRKAMVQLSDKLWPVKLISHTNGTARFGKGWLDFVTDNNVEVGDVCSFELIETNDFVLKVSICKCRGLAPNCL
ncbi:hypothetical protein F0562_003862 [Nyssa sinensis]|uniref:TF-B3 domain-containing protein n=1 Tax=Nyssa sinensis TaxID=561372 RepID=A0A5J5BX78_9ASTE|nr:hypothetical protein F0562_003862 [Nyssa sinensis]